MLSEERQNMIARMVNDSGSVKVKELSERFAVTEDSIRKDLTSLENKGLLRKIYGGAIKINEEEENERYVSQRKGKYIADKQKIAKKAVKMLKDGDVIFLDISTTNIEIAKLLRNSDLSLTIVTNMVDVMMIMMGDNHNTLIFVGGEFSEGKDGFVGEITNQEIKRYHFDVSFLGVVGVDVENNAVSTYTPEDASTKKIVMQSSRKKYMLLETRKIMRQGNYIYASISDFDGLIVEKSLDENQKIQLSKYDLGFY